MSTANTADATVDELDEQLTSLWQSLRNKPSPQDLELAASDDDAMMFHGQPMTTRSEMCDTFTSVVLDITTALYWIYNVLQKRGDTPCQNVSVVISNPTRQKT